VASNSSSTKLTYEDYLTFPNDGRRHELVDGEHFVTPSPSTKHQRIVGRLFFELQSHLRVHPGGEVLLSPYDVVLSPLDVVEPDLVYVSRENQSRITEANLQGPPDLAIEVLSESNRRHDEVTKRKLYERAGVQEYWIVDPEIETVKVHRLMGGALARIAEMSRDDGDHLSSPLLPGFSMDLGKLFG
jgi:Uma2 family endonuclease